MAHVLSGASLGGGTGAHASTPTPRAEVRVLVCVNAQKDYVGLAAMVDPHAASAAVRAIDAAVLASDHVVFLSRMRAPGDAAFATMSPAAVLAGRTRGSARLRQHSAGFIPMDICVLGSTGVQPAVSAKTRGSSTTIWYGHDPRPRLIDEVLATAARSQPDARDDRVHELVEPEQWAQKQDDTVYGDLDSANAQLLRVLKSLSPEICQEEGTAQRARVQTHAPLSITIAGFQLQSEPDVVDTARVIFRSMPDCSVSLLESGCRSLFDALRLDALPLNMRQGSTDSTSTRTEEGVAVSVSFPQSISAGADGIPSIGMLAAGATTSRATSIGQTARSNAEQAGLSGAASISDVQMIDFEALLLSNTDDSGASGHEDNAVRKVSEPVVSSTQAQTTRKPPPIVLEVERHAGETVIRIPSRSPPSQQDELAPLLPVHEADSQRERDLSVDLPGTTSTASPSSQSDGAVRAACPITSPAATPALSAAFVAEHAFRPDHGDSAASKVSRIDAKVADSTDPTNSLQDQGHVAAAVRCGDASALESKLAKVAANRAAHAAALPVDILRVACALHGQSADTAVARIPFMVIDAVTSLEPEMIVAMLFANAGGAGMTALMWACAFGNAALVRGLFGLCRYAAPCWSAATMEEQTPPSSGRSTFDAPTTSLIAALLRQQNSYGYSAIAYAAAACNANMIGVTHEAVFEVADPAFASVAAPDVSRPQYGSLESTADARRSVQAGSLSSRLRRAALRRRYAAEDVLLAICRQCSVSQVLWMLSRSRSADGWTGVHHAARSGMLARLLQELCSPFVQADCARDKPVTALQTPLAEDKTTARSMLEYVLDVRTLDGATPVHVAAFAGEPMVLVTLFEACTLLIGDAVSFTEALSSTCNVGDDDLTPLDLALLGGNVSTSRVLLRYAAPVSARLHAAAKELMYYLLLIGDGWAASRLLRDPAYGVHPDVDMVTFHLHNPLEHGCTRRFSTSGRGLSQPLLRCLRPGCGVRVCQWCSRYCNARYSTWPALQPHTHAFLGSSCAAFGIGHLLVERPLDESPAEGSGHVCACQHGRDGSFSTSAASARSGALVFSRHLPSPNAEARTREQQRARMAFKLLVLREMAFAAVADGGAHISNVATVIQAISQHLSFHAQALRGSFEEHTSARTAPQAHAIPPIDFGRTVLAIADHRGTLLTEALQRRSSGVALELLERLHDAGVGHDALMLRDESGMTALMHAATCGDEGFCRAAIDVSAAFQRARMSQNVNQLVRRYSMTSAFATLEQDTAIETRDAFGLCAVHYAAATGHSIIIRLLQEATAEHTTTARTPSSSLKQSARVAPANNQDRRIRRSAAEKAIADELLQSVQRGAEQPWVCVGVPPDLTLPPDGKDTAAMSILRTDPAPAGSCLQSTLRDMEFARLNQLVGTRPPAGSPNWRGQLDGETHRDVALHWWQRACCCSSRQLLARKSGGIAPATLAVYTGQAEAMQTILSTEPAPGSINDPTCSDATGISPYYRALLQHLVATRALLAVDLAGLDVAQGLASLAQQLATRERRRSLGLSQPQRQITPARGHWITLPAHRVPGFNPKPSSWTAVWWNSTALGQHRLADAVEEAVLSAAEPSLRTILSASSGQRAARASLAAASRQSVDPSTPRLSEETEAGTPTTVLSASTDEKAFPPTEDDSDMVDVSTTNAVIHDTRVRLKAEVDRAANLLTVLHESSRVKAHRSCFALLTLCWQLLIFMPPLVAWAFMTPAAYDFKAATLSNFRSSIENVFQDSFVFDTPMQWQQWFDYNFLNITDSTPPPAARRLQPPPPPPSGGGGGGGAGGGAGGTAATSNRTTTPQLTFVGESGDALLIPRGRWLQMGESVVIGAIRVTQLQRSVAYSCTAGLNAASPGQEQCSNVVDTSYTTSEDIQRLENLPPDEISGDVSKLAGAIAVDLPSGGLPTEEKTRRDLVRGHREGMASEADTWTSGGTRALVVDFSLYHASQQAFAVVRLYAYFPTEAVAQRSVRVRHIRPSQGRFYPSVPFSITTAMLLFVSLVALGFRMQRTLPVTGFSKFFWGQFGWADALFVCLNLVVLIYDIRNLLMIQAQALNLANTTKFYDLWYVAGQLENEADLIAILCLLLLVRAAAICTHAPIVGPTLLGIGNVLVDAYTLQFIGLVLLVTFGVGVAFSIALNAQSLYFASPLIAFQSLFGYGFAQQMYVFIGTPQRTTTFAFYLLWTLVSLTFVNIWIAILSARFIEGASMKANEMWESRLTKALQADVWNHYAAMEEGKLSGVAKVWASLAGHPVRPSRRAQAFRVPQNRVQRTRTVAIDRTAGGGAVPTPQAETQTVHEDTRYVGVVAPVQAAIHRKLPGDAGKSTLRSVVATIDRLYSAAVVQRKEVHHAGRRT